MKRFSAQECLKSLGLEEHGAVQKVIDKTVLDVCEPYIPMDSGNLIDSGILHTELGAGEVIWKTPYAHYVHVGILYVDVKTKSPFSPKDGRKEPANPEQKLKYGNGKKRGAHWVDRAMQDGGIKTVEDAARKAVKK